MGKIKRNKFVINTISNYDDSSYGQWWHSVHHKPGVKNRAKQNIDMTKLARRKEILYYCILAIKFPILCSVEDHFGLMVLISHYNWVCFLSDKSLVDYSTHNIPSILDETQLNDSIAIPDLTSQRIVPFIRELDNLSNNLFGQFERGFRVSREIYKRLVSQIGREQYISFNDFLEQRVKNYEEEFNRNNFIPNVKENNGENL